MEVSKQKNSSLQKVKSLSKKQKIIGGSVVGVVVLFVLIMVFGSPSAKTVFSGMNETMLKTKSLTIQETYQGRGSSGEAMDVETTVNMDLSNPSEVKAKGDFKIDVTTDGMPMKVEAEYIMIGDSKYIKFSKLSSTSQDIAATFAQVESALEDKWVKVRDGDSYSTFASTPIQAVSTVMPIPFANLTSAQAKEVLKIMKDSTYIIKESTKVELGDTSAYRYSLEYDRDKYDQFAKLIAGYNKFFNASDGEDSNSDIDNLDVWVDIGTKRLAKVAFEGSTDQGDIEAEILFGNYNKAFNIEKPEDYSIESELLN